MSPVSESETTTPQATSAPASPLFRGFRDRIRRARRGPRLALLWAVLTAALMIGAACFLGWWYNR